MRILVYEHITGGGMLGDPQISALAPEGEMMLRALVDDLASIPGIEVSILRDPRIALDLPVKMHVPQSEAAFGDVFERALNEADAAWPIAPEKDGILAHFTRNIVASGRTLLNSRIDAIDITTSKRATADALFAAGIPVVPVWPDEPRIPQSVNDIVVKRDDGAGCRETLLFGGRAALREWLRQGTSQKEIFQPFVRGEARSLSLLACDGRARVLACNRQHVEVIDGVFQFGGVSVNAVVDSEGRYAALAASVARALPGLWGYCGIDFIETVDGPVVIEINPRLTISYAGLRRATGLNPAQLVLALPQSLDAAQQSLPEGLTIEVEVTHVD